MNELASLLSAASESDSENVLTLENVKGWLSDYLQAREQEVSRFPTEKDRPHWDLLGADYDSMRDAMFVLAYFHDDDVTFLGGRGSIGAVHDFALTALPENPVELLDVASKRFWIGSKVTVKLVDLIRWLAA
jgi:hypothetical protein